MIDLTDISHIPTALTVAVVLIYLFYALLRPEKF